MVVAFTFEKVEAEAEDDDNPCFLFLNQDGQVSFTKQKKTHSKNGHNTFDEWQW